MSERASIAVTSETLARFNDVRKEWKLSQDDMIQALLDCWKEQSHEQQATAIRGQGQHVPNLPPAGDIDEQIGRLFRDCADVHDVLHRAVNDGRVSATEANEILASLRRLAGRTDLIAGGVREMRIATP